MVNPHRIRKRNDKGINERGAVLYWMNRDQRVEDNWALLYAQELAIQQNKQLNVVFALTPSFPGATLRHYDFMLKGLQEVEERLIKLKIAFILKLESPEVAIPKASKEYKAAAIVTDFSPLRLGREWRSGIAQNVDCAMYEVDSHNICPAWVLSKKQEFAAYTIRPKIHRIIEEYLENLPQVKKQTQGSVVTETIDWEKAYESLKCDHSIKPVDWIKPGETAAKLALEHFIDEKLATYAIDRNDPGKNNQSELSPYIHFGQLSAQRIALELMKQAKYPVAFNGKMPQGEGSIDDSVAALLEELIVRKELADNFCLYNSDYDNTKCFPDWAQQTLKEHEKDDREYIYTQAQLEQAQTHDEIWNAAQQEMLQRGKMHDYLRMYWAKKILEWTATAADAQQIAIYLNDKYFLDGRDPNGYAGIAWSIGGVHDRAWFPRPIFGKIRYMSGKRLKEKFDVESYIAKWSGGQKKLI